MLQVVKSIQNMIGGWGFLGFCSLTIMIHMIINFNKATNVNLAIPLWRNWLARLTVIRGLTSGIRRLVVRAHPEELDSIFLHFLCF